MPSATSVLLRASLLKSKNETGHPPFLSLCSSLTPSLKLLRPWLEARFAEGNRESATHDALAKILIITNDDRKEQFLEQNQFYDSLKVGEFCENNYPNLALIAYIRGNNFNEVIRVTTKHSMFKNQVRFLSSSSLIL